MKFYWKHERKSPYWAALDLKNAIPELRHVHSEKIQNHLSDMDYEFYKIKNTKVKVWIRFTFPFAILTIITMLILLPVYFLITGKWSYNIRKLADWFDSLGF